MLLRYKLIAAGGALALVAASGLAKASPFLRVATGFVAGEVCSGTYVSGLDPARVYQETLDAMSGARLLRWGLRLHVDETARIVRVSAFGGSESTSIFHPGEGCRLAFGREASAPAPQPTPPHRTDAAATAVEATDPALRAAVAAAFAEPADGPRRRTHAVVVMKDGRIIAERYAPGFAVDTPIHGFSATKSVTSALIGILVRQGRLTLDQPAPIDAWRAAGDPRGAITVAHLLRHTSGLKLGSSLSPSMLSVFDRVNRMKFAEPDMAAFAAASALGAKPGASWTYNDAHYVLLGRLIRAAAEGKGETVAAFARRELFDPLGFGETTFEVDAAGTPDGSTQLFARARDWARFGQLYLDDGQAGGRRILPAGWAAYSAAPTPLAWAGLGAGFWTNQGDSPGARRRIAEGMPADAFMARGMFGQYVIVVPSHRLVVARFGASPGDGDEAGVARLVHDVVAITRSSEPADVSAADLHPR